MTVTEDMQHERIFMLTNDSVTTIPEYGQMESKLRRLGRLIMDALGPERLLFIEYERLMYLMEGLNIESAYGAGLTDVHANQNADQMICTALK